MVFTLSRCSAGSAQSGCCAWLRKAAPGRNEQCQDEENIPDSCAWRRTLFTGWTFIDFC
ncbi:hypothetical protein A2U01_0034204 [Trifolium medium]|uniref:Uncharacterized protein n=1 Tax=Trifolium medium TaxID=97028 RepID=A0A392PLW9_9FABA|nr:hypothetical protein [Trifolium medium]